MNGFQKGFSFLNVSASIWSKNIQVKLHSHLAFIYILNTMI